MGLPKAHEWGMGRQFGIPNGSSPKTLTKPQAQPDPKFSTFTFVLSEPPKGAWEILVSETLILESKKTQPILEAKPLGNGEGKG